MTARPVRLLLSIVAATTFAGVLHAQAADTVTIATNYDYAMLANPLPMGIATYANGVSKILPGCTHTEYGCPSSWAAKETWSQDIAANHGGYISQIDLAMYGLNQPSATLSIGVNGIEKFSKRYRSSSDRSCYYWEDELLSPCPPRVVTRQVNHLDSTAEFTVRGVNVLVKHGDTITLRITWDRAVYFYSAKESHAWSAATVSGHPNKVMMCFIHGTTVARPPLKEDHCKNVGGGAVLCLP